MELNEIKTPEDAAIYLRHKFNGLEVYVKNQTKQEFGNFCHSQMSGGIGMQIRNELKLWIPETPLAEYMKKELEIGHADGMSAFIIGLVYDKIENEILENGK